jgi:1-acyl-sn-glycerol-3-phosphate acyltransferase
LEFYRYTLFNTPVITSLFRIGARLVLKLRGWKISGELPDVPRFIVIAYPHTSNWDVPLTLSICLMYRLRIHWMGKSSLFRGPMGPVMKWLGGIPVYLHESRGVVQQLINAFDNADELIIFISPEANRAYVENWKTGFYHVAVGAGLPIVLGFLDFARREGGYRGTFMPTGDLDRDLARIKAQYKGIKGKYPEQSVY